MSVMRLVPVALLAGLALAVSGCGAAKQGTATGGATLAPATAPAFVAIDSDLQSSQWRTVDKLLSAFPGKSELLDYLRSSLREDHGLDYERDVKPALGSEIDLVWLDFADDGSNLVGVTKPKDEATFRRMVEKGNRKGPNHLLLE